MATFALIISLVAHMWPDKFHCANVTRSAVIEDAYGGLLASYMWPAHNDLNAPSQS